MSSTQTCTPVFASVYLQVGPAGLSKACIDCPLSLVCGYRMREVTFFHCSVCGRNYVPVVLDPRAVPPKTKQILVKKECPARVVLSINQPCWQCMNRRPLRASRRSQNKRAMRGEKR